MARTAVGRTALGSRRLDSLTGARFVAALGVFLFHAGQIFPQQGVFGRSLGFIGRDGWVGVDFFFALSGFVLAWSWRPGGSVTAFYRRRFARLAPAYWVALVLGLAWGVVLYRDPSGAALRAIPAVLGLQAWFPDPAVHFAGNGVEWSVSAELFFYALFPILIGAVHRRVGRVVLVVLAVALGGAAPVVLGAALPAGLGSWAVDIFPITRIGEFLCGLLLAVALQQGRRVPVRPVVAVAVFLLCYLLLPVAPAWVPQRAVFLVAILLVIAALAQADLRGARSVAASRGLVRLGEWSYCFYLVHQVTSQVMLFLCAKVVPGKALGPVWAVSALAASIVLAAVLYHFVERPLERRLRGTPTPRAMLADASARPVAPSGP
jgi:peptidoglycan/LPS O-acetylase OafA/YrhL